MRAFIVTDLEGISGICRISQVADTQSPDYVYSIERLMLDTNAAVEGALEGGAEAVYVWDGHGGGSNFIPGALNKRAVPCTIDALPQMGGWALLHVGAHAMAGTLDAFLDHTQSSLAWHDYSVNGRSMGEMGQLAIVAGLRGAPCVMASGDMAACAEARRFFGDIPTAVVKFAQGRNNARPVEPDEALRRIREAAREGMERAAQFRPFRPLFPLDIRIAFNRSDYCEDALARNPDAERLDARTLRRVVRNVARYADVLM